MLFDHFKSFLDRWLGWLFLPFGTRSLTAYIVHGSILFIAAAVAPLSGNIWYNTLLGIVVILLTWLLVSERHVQKVIPQ